MDVQAATATVPPPVLSPFGPTSPSAGGSAPSPGPSPLTAPAGNLPPAAPSTPGGSGPLAPTGGAGTGATDSAIGPTPGLATLPAGPPDGSKKGSDDTTLASGVAQLYNVQQSNVSVSFQISQDPNEIVTVFTNTKTGKVIVQFPSETMIALAKLFDKLDGSVVNKKV